MQVFHTREAEYPNADIFLTLFVIFQLSAGNQGVIWTLWVASVENKVLRAASFLNYFSMLFDFPES